MSIVMYRYLSYLKFSYADFKFRASLGISFLVKAIEFIRKAHSDAFKEMPSLRLAPFNILVKTCNVYEDFPTETTLMKVLSDFDS